ncbi:hypothetical protein GCM10010174_46190 [Kutzneria viridogrisea]
MCRAEFWAILVAMSGKRWRQLTLWLHVVCSVGWLSQALALLVLTSLALGTADVAVRGSALTMAKHLDMALLAELANVSAFTGFVLAAATAWGFFRHWWVLVKFVITVVQLYLGIFALAGALREAARTGAPSVWLAVGAGLMAAAIAFQAWVSVAKPWAKTPWAGTGKLPTAPRWVFVLAVAAPVLDLTAGTALGYPLPAAEVLVLVTVLVRRSLAKDSPRKVPAALRA